MSRIDPGEGYRLLEDGEVIHEGDEYRRDGLWSRSHCWGGTFYNSAYLPHRRKLPPFPVEFGQQVADIMADKPAESGWVLTADRKPAEDDTDEREHVWVQSPTGEVSYRYAYFVNEEHCPYWHPKPKAEKPAPYAPPVPEPEPLYEAWVNVYQHTSNGRAHPTKEAADRIALPGRIRCVRVREVRDDQPTPEAIAKVREHLDEAISFHSRDRRLTFYSQSYREACVKIRDLLEGKPE